MNLTFAQFISSREKIVPLWKKNEDDPEIRLIASQKQAVAFEEITEQFPALMAQFPAVQFVYREIGLAEVIRVVYREENRIMALRVKVKENHASLPLRAKVELLRSDFVSIATTDTSSYAALAEAFIHTLEEMPRYAENKQVKRDMNKPLTFDHWNKRQAMVHSNPTRVSVCEKATATIQKRGWNTFVGRFQDEQVDSFRLPFYHEHQYMIAECVVFQEKKMEPSDVTIYYATNRFEKKDVYYKHDLETLKQLFFDTVKEEVTENHETVVNKTYTFKEFLEKELQNPGNELNTYEDITPWFSTLLHAFPAIQFVYRRTTANREEVCVVIATEGKPLRMLAAEVREHETFIAPRLHAGEWNEEGTLQSIPLSTFQEWLPFVLKAIEETPRYTLCRKGYKVHVRQPVTFSRWKEVIKKNNRKKYDVQHEDDHCVRLVPKEDGHPCFTYSYCEEMTKQLQEAGMKEAFVGRVEQTENGEKKEDEFYCFFYFKNLFMFIKIGVEEGEEAKGMQATIHYATNKWQSKSVSGYTELDELKKRLVEFANQA